MLISSNSVQYLKSTKNLFLRTSAYGQRPLQTPAPVQAKKEEESEFEDRVIHINRCAKVVKGGRRFSFAAIVVVGDKKGKVGIGNG